MIAGCQAAWAFFGGVFAVLIPDNLKPVIADADAVKPPVQPGLAGLRRPCRVPDRSREGGLASLNRLIVILDQLRHAVFVRFLTDGGLR